jgi:hypothetical protein
MSGLLGKKWPSELDQRLSFLATLSREGEATYYLVTCFFEESTPDVAEKRGKEMRDAMKTNIDGH